MRSGKPKPLWIGLGAIALIATAVHADLQHWVQHIPAGPLLAVFFRSMPMPGGAVDFRRPPKETIPALTAKIAAAPNAPDLYRLRASEEELALDFAAAGADWRKYAEIAPDRGAAYLELANYFHRRIEPRNEIAALRIAAATPDKRRPQPEASQQRAWKAFERILTIADDQDLPAALYDAAYRSWIARYPREREPRQKYIEYLETQQEYAAVETQIAAYARAFPDDAAYPLEARANLAVARGSIDAAIRIYDQAFQPLWPADLAKTYFSLLDAHGRLRDFTARACTALERNPTDLDSTARLFQYFLFQNNQVAAHRVLIELRLAKEMRKQPWAAGDLLTMARLFQRIGDVNETARFYYALYSLPGASPVDIEQALAGIAELLFANAGSLQFGAGDLSFYRDIATIDASPGFFNGILSLILNSTSPRFAYSAENQGSVAYFQRARAAQLVDLFDRRFPQSAERSALHASLIESYATYGDDEAIIRFGRAFLSGFPRAPQRVSIALLMADAYARRNDNRDEFALYDQLLRELAAQSHGFPLSGTTQRAAAALSPQPELSAEPSAEAPAQPAAPANVYASILDRYLSRLAALERPMDALRVYRREIDRNPNEAELYERLAAFLEQNGMGQQVESVYRSAIAKFPDRSWYDRLARWYLRQKQTSAFQTLTQQVVAIFSGTDLEKYFAQVVPAGSIDPALYRQLNLYAHDRFPEDLVFVHNLLDAYATRDTYDAAASERLLRQYWFYEPGLKNRLFEQLASSGKLYAEIDATRRQNPGIASNIASGGAAQTVASNPAAAQFSAEAEAWLCHFEAAAPEMRALADAYPGERSFTERASSIYRSLAAYDPANTDVAVSLTENEYRSDPRNRDALARIGDIYADRERFTQARAVWDRMPRIEPGKTDGYLDAATVFWDYYMYKDALRIIRRARADFDDPALFAFEAGAIYENERQPRLAIAQYVAGALAGNDQAEQRLLRLATRPSVQGLVDKLTAAASTDSAVKLRAAILDKQQRPKDLETFLLAQVSAAPTASRLADLGQLAANYNLRHVEEQATQRRIALTNDPVEKMRLRIDLAKLYEEGKNLAAASQQIDALYRDNPLILGVVRASVDFYTRNKQPDRAITILLDAAGHARTDLGHQFTLEAANIATGADRFDRARSLLSALLKTDPYNGEYLAAMAETYTKAGDDRGLRDYQLATIALLKSAPLPVADRTDRIAALRRALIPALTRLNDPKHAVDQYIEVINRYPEDDSLAREALLYAAAHNRTAQLLDFYKKTIAEAPRDYRWPIVLARLETYAEDYPAAIAAYDRAMKARPDRADIVQARAQLEERLMRFADALRTYSRLYELTYHDPQWMGKIAELHARLGQPEETVAALKTAVIGAHSETTGADFEIAGKLDSWNLVSQAASFAERGAQLAGNDLADQGDLRTWARVMTRARKINPVLDFAAANEREQYLLDEAGAVVATYYTPEEKAALEKQLLARTPLPRLAASAGLVALDVRWRLDAMSKPDAPVDSGLVQLQLRRGQFAALARQLEAYAAQPGHADTAAAALSEAAENYIRVGDLTNQLRVMRMLANRGILGGALLDRYLALLAADHPEDLIDFIRANKATGVADRAVQYAIASGSEPLALRAVQQRGAVATPVWTRSYTALTGLYYSDRAATIDAAFTSALDTRTIGERLKAPLNRDDQLAGEVWFYYGARYGEYLHLIGRPGAADYLPATVEQAPGNPDAYLALGDYYAENREAAKAITEFDAVLQLDAERGDAEDHIARLLWSLRRRDEAVAHWRLAFAAFLKQESSGGAVPEPFWGRVVATIRDIGEATALRDLQPDIARLLDDYVNRNGSYRAGELLQAAFVASIHANLDPAWVIDLARRGPEAETLLDGLLSTPKLKLAQRIQIQRALIAVIPRDQESRIRGQQLQLMSMLLEAGDLNAANAEWARIPEPARIVPDALDVRVRLAAANGSLRQLLDTLRTKENISTGALRPIAISLKQRGSKDAALTLLEFIYRSDLDSGNLDSANFLGLAEVLLERNDTADALAQLRRMTLVTTDAFETLLPAADLLSRYGKNAEAAEFVQKRIQAVPWDAAAKLRLVRLGPRSDRGAVLEGVAADPQTPYATRADAAHLLAPKSPAALAGTELGLLAGDHIVPDAARKPYYVDALIAAAEETSDPSTRFAVLREALAIAPANDSVRLATVRAALDAKRDSIAIAVFRSGLSSENGAITADLVERLSAAAQRLDDLAAAHEYLQRAIDLTPEKDRPPLDARMKTLEAEQTRRAQNAARQPVIKNVVDQEAVVRPRLTGTVQ